MVSLLLTLNHLAHLFSVFNIDFKKNVFSYWKNVFPFSKKIYWGGSKNFDFSGGLYYGG